MGHDLFEYEEYHTREEVAAVLRSLADELEDGDEVTVDLGEGVTVTPNAVVELEVDVEREGPHDAPHEVELGVEVEWEHELYEE